MQKIEVKIEDGSKMGAKTPKMEAKLREMEPRGATLEPEGGQMEPKRPKSQKALFLL